MPQPGPELEGQIPDWDEFRRKLEEFDHRIASLEHRLEELGGAEARQHAGTAAEPARIRFPENARSVRGISPVMGRALLGMAGAYVLRALTESQALPQKVGVFAGILYAICWLNWAARARSERGVEAALYSLTSALVLGPLLWESTIRFRAISTWTAAWVLLSFTVFGLAISWRKNLLVVATITVLTGVLASAALLIGSRDVVPFTFSLLAMAAAVEASACMEHWLSERWLAAAAANLSVLLATYLVTNARGIPEGYAPVSHGALVTLQMALPAIYLTSIAARTLLRGFLFTFFETAQLGMTLLLAVGGGLRLAGMHPGMTVAMAAVCLGCGTLCYLLSFAVSAWRGKHTYAAFGLILLLSGCRIALSGTAAAQVWWLLAVICFSSGIAALEWHGYLYLLLGLFFSGALVNATVLLAGSGASTTSIGPVFGGSAVVLLCYAAAMRRRNRNPVGHAILAGSGFWLIGGIAAAGLTGAYHTILGESAPHAYCDTVRSAILVSGALLLAWAGSHWKRFEFVPLVYVIVCAGAYRLLFVDLRQERKGALVLSLLLYGLALILLPRWMQPARTVPS